MEKDTCPNNKAFTIILVAIIFGWILINLWTVALDNILYRACGLSKNSWLHTLLVAIIATCIFLIYVSCVEEKGTIRTKMTGVLISPTDPSLSLTD